MPVIIQKKASKWGNAFAMPISTRDVMNGQVDPVEPNMVLILNKYDLSTYRSAKSTFLAQVWDIIDTNPTLSPQKKLQLYKQMEIVFQQVAPLV